METLNASQHPPSSRAQRAETAEGDVAELTYDSLDANDRIRLAIDAVRRDDAGAIATFLGTTRDNFQGKRVTRLEYQAYTPLAMKTMLQILSETHSPSGLNPIASLPPNTTSSLSPPAQSHSQGNDDLPPQPRPALRSLIIHRLGVVPVSETSIIIAVSSPHRREAFETCEWLLERVKKDVQVWKREWYAPERDEQAVDVEPVVGKDGETGEAGRLGESMWKANG